MNTPDPALVAGLHPHSCNLLQSEPRFSFTPIKSLKPPPRLWDRKPTTPLAARGSRKLWKRFEPSINTMRNAQRSIAMEKEDELRTEINEARIGDYLRGVKRLCLGLRDGNNGQEDRHSFLETKWELEISMKKRKPSWKYRSDAADAGQNAEDQQTQLSDGPSASPAANEKDAATPAVRELTQMQESRLVRSALRSSLDGEDTVLLNNFLSKAQAKRAAKAMDAHNAEEKSSQDEMENSCPTPPRRALDRLDANSPSPTKAQFSPRKVKAPEGSPALADLASKDGEKDKDKQSDSPTTRRSTRGRQPTTRSNPPPRATPPAVRNTFLRRAKGTEFIFRGRTEEKELEMKTRANTLQNKGDAVLPKAALKVMLKQPPAESTSMDGFPELRDGQDSGHAGQKAEKHVSWRKLRFVEYESGVYDDDFSDSSSESDIPAEKATTKRAEKKEPASKAKDSSSRSARSARTQGSKKASGKTTEKPAAATGPTPNVKVRRVRRLGPRTTIPDTPESPDLSRDSTSAMNRRKKLAPSSPSAALFATPASKKTASTKSASTNDRTTTNSKRILTSDAGSTPKPKRARSKT